MNLQLHEHISRLLFDHECVIIPGFGAFLTRTYSAEVNHATHMMRPPSKRVHFNGSITENEGLLAKAISHTEGVTYTKALEIIEADVRGWREILASDKKINLPGIGRLYIDEVSHKLQFSPSLETNYSTTSYGLSIFRSPAIQREAQIRKTIHETIEKHVVTESKEGEKRKIAAWIPWAAALAPIVFAGVIGYSYLSHGHLSPMQNAAGIHWMQFSRTTETVSPVSEDITKDESEVSSIDAATVPSSESVDVPVEIEETPVAKPGFHIVVGSFKESANAKNYMLQLKAKGYQAYLPDGDKRFWRVAVGGYNTHQQAEQAIGAIKQNINPQSWIYSN